MIEFEPPEELMKNIESKSYFNLQPKFSQEEFRENKKLILTEVNKYFLGKAIPRSRFEMQTCLYIPINEILKNARAHGGSKDNLNTIFGLFLNPISICLGCYDGGDYFKRKDIKKIWESKEHLTEFHEAEDEAGKELSGAHVGKMGIESVLNKIYINDSLGIIYGRHDLSKELREKYSNK